MGQGSAEHHTQTEGARQKNKQTILKRKEKKK